MSHAKKEKPETIDWAKSESKQIVLDDLEAGVISLDNTDTAHDLYYGMYQFSPEFIKENVPYAQFRARLNDHRKQLTKRNEMVSWQAAALAHDRNLYPQRTHNSRGEKVFYLTPAYKQLAQDVADKMHLSMKPSELREFRRELYGEFSLKIFDQRIRQAVRRERMVNYLNDKREAEQKERRERRINLGLSEETPVEQFQRLSMRDE